MSGRVVAEAMGWEWQPPKRLDNHVYSPMLSGWWKNPLTGGGGNMPPTPDDMLAWLREQLGWELIDVELSAPGYRVVLEIEDGEDGEVLCPADEPAPTIHAALEAAVLAVAEQVGALTEGTPR